MKKDDLWFKDKSYGYGWVPCSWQGFVVTLLYVTSVLSLFQTSVKAHHMRSDVFLDFIIPFAFLTSLFIMICIFKGEKPEWRWGKGSKFKNKN